MGEHRDDVKERLVKAAIKGVRLYGLDGVRVQHIGKLAESVTSNIYFYFNNKDDLLRAAFERVDRQIAHIFDRVKADPKRVAADPEGEIWRLWSAYWHWLTTHPDETVFYHRYRDSPTFPAYEKERDISYFASFLQSVKLFLEHYEVDEQEGIDLLWLHLLSTTVLYAKYVAEGVLANDDATEQQVFQLIMSGLGGLLSSGCQTKGEDDHEYTAAVC